MKDAQQLANTKEIPYIGVRHHLKKIVDKMFIVECLSTTAVLKRFSGLSVMAAYTDHLDEWAKCRHQAP